MKEMGWYLFEDDPTTHGRFCCDCNSFQSWESFYTLPHGRNGRQSQCILCNNFHRKWRYDYRRDHTAPKQCECCGRTACLEVDHDHDTNQFRRWLCRSCNRIDRRWYRMGRIWPLQGRQVTESYLWEIQINRYAFKLTENLSAY